MIAAVRFPSINRVLLVAGLVLAIVSHQIPGRGYFLRFLWQDGAHLTLDNEPHSLTRSPRIGHRIQLTPKWFIRQTVASSTVFVCAVTSIFFRLMPIFESQSLLISHSSLSPPQLFAVPAGRSPPFSL